jgi:hypothetical protein
MIEDETEAKTQCQGRKLASFALNSGWSWMDMDCFSFRQALRNRTDQGAGKGDYDRADEFNAGFVRGTVVLRTCSDSAGTQVLTRPLVSRSRLLGFYHPYFFDRSGGAFAPSLYHPFNAPNLQFQGINLATLLDRNAWWLGGISSTYRSLTGANKETVEATIDRWLFAGLIWGWLLNWECSDSWTDSWTDRANGSDSRLDRLWAIETVLNTSIQLRWDKSKTSPKAYKMSTLTYVIATPKEVQV